MIKTNSRILDRVLAVVLAIMMIIATVPMNVFAVSVTSATLTTTLEKEFIVNEEKEFSFTTTANGDAGKYVLGTFVFSDKDAVASLKYQDSATGEWHEFWGDFGPPGTGFPLTDATSKFRVTFNKTGKYTVKASIISAADRSVVCETEEVEIDVKVKPSVLTSNIGTKIFNVGEVTEFTFSTVANGHAGTMVIGSANFDKPEVIDSLEYLEVNDGKWYKLDGEFGPTQGFPMSTATSTFRVVFNKAGSYTFTAFMKDAKTGEILCSTEENVTVVHKLPVTATANEGGKITVNGEAKDKVFADYQTDVNINVTPDKGYLIKEIKLNGVSQTIKNKNGETLTINKIEKATEISVIFVKVYTITVTSDGNGKVTTSPEIEAGEVIVETDSNLTINTTPAPGHHVSEVTVDGKPVEISGGNDYAYSDSLNIKQAHTIKITFSPNIYSVTVADNENGNVSVSSPSVEYENDVTVTIVPDDGYTIDEISVLGKDRVPVTAVEKDGTDISFKIEKITEDKKVVVTFKEKEKASKTDVSINSDDALRVNSTKTLYVIKEGKKITVSTQKDGIRFLTADGNVIAGAIGTKSLDITKNTAVSIVEVYYKAENELYADWHEVSNVAFDVSVDKSAPVIVLTPDREVNAKGYYNSDISFSVSADDKGDFSGLETVEYWITKDGMEGRINTLYSHESTVKESFNKDNAFVVDASVYNSDNLKITIRVVDRAGNEKIIEKLLKINSTSPEVSIKIDGTKKDDAEDYCYASDRKLTITIVDRADTFSEESVLAGLKIIADGKKIDLQKSDLSWNVSGTSHEISYKFTKDAKYTWEFNYENHAGLCDKSISVDSQSANVYSFTVDKQAPSNLKITYIPTVTDTFLNSIFFGAPVLGEGGSLKVKIEAKDEVSDIKEFLYSYAVAENVSSKNQGMYNVSVTGEDIKEDNGVKYAEFSIPSYFRGNVSFRAKDNAGNISELTKDETTIVVDTVAPGIDVVFEPAQSLYGKYFDTFRKATITIDEVNFFEEDIKDEKLLITLSKTYADGTVKEEKLKPVFTPSETEDKYTAEILFEEDAEYSFDIKYTDRAGNEYDGYDAQNFVIDTTAPVIKLEYNNNEVYNGNFFKDQRKATFTVIEHNFVAENMIVEVNGTPVTVDWKKSESSHDTYTAEYTFTGDDKYTVAVYGTDAANNSNKDVTVAQETVAAFDFTVDKTSPENLKISYAPDFIGTLIEDLTFGFYKNEVNVRIEAEDSVSDIKEFVYSYVVENGASSVNTGKENVTVKSDEMKQGEGNIKYYEFSIPAQYRGKVYFEAKNLSELSSSKTDTNTVVVDNIAPNISVSFDNNEFKNSKYYDNDRTATVIIKEANFFNKNDLADNKLVITKYTRLDNETEYKSQVLTPEFKPLASEEDAYFAEIEFNENADYKLEIEYQDRSGNDSDKYTSGEFTIDKIDPVISITELNGAYIKTARESVTVTVIEHNFDASKVNFNVNTFDVSGNEITPAFDYNTYLKTQSNWSAVPGTQDKYEAKIPFVAEANYVLTASMEDLAGNTAKTPIEDTFCYDNTIPYNLTVSYKETVVEKIVNAVTFGYFKNSVDVTVTADDGISGVEKFICSYKVSEGASNINVGSLKDIELAASQVENSKTFTATFSIPAQFKGNVTFNAIDKSGNDASLTDEEKTIVVDNVAPGVSVVFPEPVKGESGNLYLDSTFATITVKEANFDENDVKVTVGRRDDFEGDYNDYPVSLNFTKLDTLDGEPAEDTYRAVIDFTEGGHYTFDIYYKDKSGNECSKYEGYQFIIDGKKPEIKVTFENNNAENEKYFSEDRTATIEIEEHNFDPSKVTLTIEKNGILSETYNDELKDINNWTKNGDIYTFNKKIEFKVEGHYTFAISCVDKTGNQNEGVNYGESVAPTEFTLDKSAPGDLNVTISDVSVLDNDNSIAFDKFYQNSVTVKLSANCNISGLDSLEYQKVATAAEYDVNGEWIDYNAAKGIVVSPVERFVIYVKATDKAGNVSYANSTGIVVDNKAPEGEINAPQVDIIPENAPISGIFTKDVNVSITVIDPKYNKDEKAEDGHYSGLSKITYKIFTDDTNAVEEKTLFDIERTINTGDTSTENGLVNRWTGNIVIDSKKFNSNKVKVQVQAFDNAGNEVVTTTTQYVKIDVTQPEIHVSYNNNILTNGRYFAKDRIATVTVTERNFNAAKVNVEIKNSDGIIPEISWTPGESAVGNGDNTTYIGTIKYVADGDYTFDISCKDDAGLECNSRDVDYAAGTKNAKEFTVDKTAPVVSIEKLNGKFIKENTISKITVTEHNFRASDFILEITAVDNDAKSVDLTKHNYGKILTKEDSWTAVEGKADTYEATVSFTDEGYYTVKATYSDLAGNVQTNEVCDNFCLDKTVPTDIKINIGKNSVLGSNNVKFDTFYGKEIEVELSADFDISGMQSLQYQKVSSIANYKADGMWTDYDFENKIKIVPSEKFIIFVKAVDKSGNVSYAYSTGIVVDDKAPGSITKEFDIDIIPENTNKNGYYSKDVNVQLNVAEPKYSGSKKDENGNYSGLKNIVCEVYTTDTNVKETATLFALTGNSESDITLGAVYDEDNLVKEWNGSITIDSEKFNSNNVFVKITATDNAGNTHSTTTAPGAIKIDITKPVINVSYDNNEALNGKYFKADRTATVTVTERNLDTKDIFLDIKNSDGIMPEISNWTEKKGTGNFDDTTYTATIKYTADGDYEFAVSCVDLAGYKCEKDDVKYTNCTAPISFTLDKTIPEISIKNSNGAYYNSDKAVVITVKEHNFRASEFDFSSAAYNYIGKNAETAANKSENAVDISVKQYAEYLKNPDSWKMVSPDTYEAVITFDIEANYEIVATYSDLAGNNQKEAIKDTFTVDKTVPQNLKISYTPGFVGTLLENITFGFYSSSVKVTIEATDETAGVDYFVYSYKVDSAVSSVNKGEENVKIDAIIEKGTNRAYAEFTIPSQFRGKVSFTAVDKAKNENSLGDNNVVIVDDIAPGVEINFPDPVKDKQGNYYIDNVSATITITEANFFGTKEWDYKDFKDNNLVITVEKRLNTEDKFTSTNIIPEFKKGNGDTYVAEIPFNEDADYTFDIIYTDKSGNVYDGYTKYEFTVDKIAPVIKVNYDNNSVLNNTKFKADRTATIVIEEHNFDAKLIKTTVTAINTEKQNVEVENYAEYLSDNKNWTRQGNTYIAEISFTQEADYTFSIECVDLAGTVNSNVIYAEGTKAAEAFTIDKTNPTGSIQIGRWEQKWTSYPESKEQDFRSFGLWDNKTVKVSLENADELSGIDYVEQFRTNEILSLDDVKSSELWTKVTLDKDNSFKYEISPDERFVVYVHIVDKAGNERYITSNGVILDATLPDYEKVAPVVTINPEQPSSDGIYSSDVFVDLKVEDPMTGAKNTFSGLKSVTYKIFNKSLNKGETLTAEGTLYKYDKEAPQADELVQWLSTTEKNEFNTQLERILVDAKENNSNIVTVEIIATDNSDNSTLASCDIKIDITAPEIKVTYNNNKVDSGYYFDANRTATIVITERNFDPADVKISITNTEEVIPTLGQWKKQNGTGNLDNTTWTNKLEYTADGDYEFSIEYEDLAGLKCTNADVDFADSAAASKFTIDKIRPAVKVSYDNNAALNSNYYKDERVATIVIDEHNLEPNTSDKDRVDISVIATDDGRTIAAPTVSPWITQGDTHTATIRYSADALYVFDVSIKDKAGNNSVDFDEQRFYVDKTAPELDITGVLNQSANKGDVIPVVTYSDTNYDAENVKITLTGAVRDGVVIDGAYSDIHNGRTFTFRNFAKEKEIDDIYTLSASLTDKAGNTTSKSIVFSVNRFGSTYALNETTKKLNGTYIKTAEDIVITETNANELSNIIVTLFKNNETTVLKEGTDYVIGIEGGNGNWYKYTYTVFAKNFESDGVYSITVESDDKAGNDAKNDQDTKNTEISFGVDGTLPIINIANLTSNTTYAMDKLTVNMSVEDNLKLAKVIAELDGVEIMTWKGEELDAIVKDGGNFSFDISGDSTDAHNLVVYAVDEAGNGEKASGEQDPENKEAVDNFYVTTNLWVRYYTNKPLFFGSIAGVILLAGFIVFLVVYKKKKNEERK